MNLTKCKNGHFYDSDTYASCPHCAGADTGADNKTVAFDNAGQSMQAGISATMDLDSFVAANSRDVSSVLQGTQGAAGTGAQAPGQDLSKQVSGRFSGGNDPDDSKTISIYQLKKDDVTVPDPVVGWLVCTKGKFFGRDFRLKSGRNFIGRGNDMDVCLAGENTVSRNRHATVIHEPRKNIFIAQPGDSRELFYVNGDVVLSSIEIKKNDVLQVGDVQLMLIPCCDDSFKWENEN